MRTIVTSAHLPSNFLELPCCENDRMNFAIDKIKNLHVALYMTLQKSFLEGIPIIPVVTAILVNQEGYTTDRQ